MLINPHKPQTAEWKKFEALKLIQSYKRAEENPRANVAEVQDVVYGKNTNLLTDERKLKEWLGVKGDQDLATALRFAEGGEIDSMPVGDLSLLSQDMEYEYEEDLTSPDLTALQDVLGEAKYAELESAMADYPVVTEVAEMATYQADGEVSGPGTEKSDSVPARLSDGEYVWSAEALRAFEDQYGEGSMEQLHNEFRNTAAMELV